VLVVFDPAKTSYEEMLRLFWENHDPTQGMRQGNDVGTQYRSGVYWTSEEQRRLAEASRTTYAEQLKASGYPEPTTEIAQAGPFYYAEDYHQQYLHKNPWGYCGIGGTGVSCPVGIAAARGATTAESLS
jgi:peptide-methionine (S)-S-oxide reductase